jgi:hypothetical protein
MPRTDRSPDTRVRATIQGIGGAITTRALGNESAIGAGNVSLPPRATSYGCLFNGTDTPYRINKRLEFPSKLLQSEDKTSVTSSDWTSGRRRTHRYSQVYQKDVLVLVYIHQVVFIERMDRRSRLAIRSVRRINTFSV